MTQPLSEKRITSIDINADLGEGMPWDERLMPLITSTSLSCGAHAGDPTIIARTAQSAAQNGVRIGAHPGYPDRAGFGRRPCRMSRREIRDLACGQVGALQRILAGVTIRFVKAHGALYNQAMDPEQPEIALGLADAVEELGLPLYGQPGTFLENHAKSRGLRYITEGFPDRGYAADGRLIPRDQPGAIASDPEEIAKNLDWFFRTGIESLCLHGDHADVMAMAALVRDYCRKQSVDVRCWE